MSNTITMEWDELAATITNLCMAVHKQEGRGFRDRGFREVVPVMQNKEELIVLLAKHTPVEFLLQGVDKVKSAL